MADPRFFRTAGPFSVGELARLTGAEIGGAGDRDLMLEGVAPIETAGRREVSFLANARYGERFAKSAAGAAFVPPSAVAKAPPAMTLLITTKPYLAYAQATQAFHPAEWRTGIAATAAIDPDAEIGPDVHIGHHVVIEAGARIGARTQIGANSVIGPGVVIGTECRIGANVTISHCLMGDRVTLFPGVRIGQDGFGFAADAAGHVKIPQMGRVIIEDDVRIGANSTVDRGAGPDTVIGAGSMIDNLVQIAHNVVMGRGCIMAAQSGLAGSTRLGAFVMVGAQAGIIGHLTVGDGAKIAGKAGVIRDVPAGGTAGGVPAVPMIQWMRQTAILDRMANKKDK